MGPKIESHRRAMHFARHFVQGAEARLALDNDYLIHPYHEAGVAEEFGEAVSGPIDNVGNAGSVVKGVIKCFSVRHTFGKAKALTRAFELNDEQLSGKARHHLLVDTGLTIYGRLESLFTRISRENWKIHSDYLVTDAINRIANYISSKKLKLELSSEQSLENENVKTLLLALQEGRSGTKSKQILYHGVLTGFRLKVWDDTYTVLQDITTSKFYKSLKKKQAPVSPDQVNPLTDEQVVALKRYLNRGTGIHFNVPDEDKLPIHQYRREVVLNELKEKLTYEKINVFHGPKSSGKYRSIKLHLSISREGKFYDNIIWLPLESLINDLKSLAEILRISTSESSKDWKSILKEILGVLADTNKDTFFVVLDYLSNPELLKDLFEIFYPHCGSEAVGRIPRIQFLCTTSLTLVDYRLNLIHSLPFSEEEFQSLVSGTFLNGCGFTDQAFARLLENICTSGSVQGRPDIIYSLIDAVSDACCASGNEEAIFKCFEEKFQDFQACLEPGTNSELEPNHKWKDLLLKRKLEEFKQAYEDYNPRASFILYFLTFFPASLSFVPKELVYGIGAGPGFPDAELGILDREGWIVWNEGDGSIVVNGNYQEALKRYLRTWPAATLLFLWFGLKHFRDLPNCDKSLAEPFLSFVDRAVDAHDNNNGLSVSLVGLESLMDRIKNSLGEL